MAGLTKEYWEAEVFRLYEEYQEKSHLAKIKDKSSKVSYTNGTPIINLAYSTDTPNVIVDNSIYPLVSRELDATPQMVRLKMLDTEPTDIPMSKQYGLMYKDRAEHIAAHSFALNSGALKLANHSLAIEEESVNEPVLFTTGQDDGTGRKRMTWADLLRIYQYAQDSSMGENRVLVLSTEHKIDLLKEDKEIFNQMANHATGSLGLAETFNVYEVAKNYMPYYEGVGEDSTTYQKLAYGEAVLPSHTQGSFFYDANLSMRAGTMSTMQESTAETSPLYKKSIVSFRKYDIYANVGNTRRGIIFSGTV